MRQMRHFENMTPRNHLLNSENPRIFSKGEIYNKLKSVGYVIQPTVLNDLLEMLFCHMPLLIEGQRGAGKTALPEYLAKAFNLNVYYLQCVEGLEIGDILYEWEKSLQNQFVEQATNSGLSLTEARKQIWTKDFLKIGEVLAAFADSPKNFPNILIIDEIDKLPSVTEDILLQVLGRNYAQIPRLEPSSLIGIPEGSEKPLIFLTSNNHRSGVSAPLRSRCLFSYINPPTVEEEINIINAQIPGIDPKLSYKIVRLLTYIRKSPISDENKPAIREAINLANSLFKKNINTITVEVLIEHLCHIAKTEDDKFSLLQSKEAIIGFVENEQKLKT